MSGPLASRRKKVTGGRALRRLDNEDIQHRTSVGCSAERSKIIAMPKTLAQQSDKGDDGITPVIGVVKLRHPKTGTGDMFMFDGANMNVYQLMSFKEKHSSWFVGDTLQKDGSMVFATPIDPLFLLLPYLTQSTKFRPLDQIIVDDEFPECKRLLSCKALDQIKYIAELKEFGGLKAYRYDVSKCMTWLAAKVRCIISVLRSKGVDVSTGARAATFVMHCRQTNADQDDCTRYAHGLISEYLPIDVSHALLQHLGVTQASLDTEVTTEPPVKRSKFESATGPLEDYSAGCDKLKVANKQAPKLTINQRALSKVDKSGMKSISSFFGKRE